MYLEWTGFKPSWRGYEVGTTLFLKMAEDLCRTGVEAIDCATGASFYKERFGDAIHYEEFASVYAPGVRGLSVNLIVHFDQSINQLARRVATRLGMIDKLRKLWRRRLSKTGKQLGEKRRPLDGVPVRE
jgi:CelD/BcsL family acetyltransferase involved in cellulose biosynthesis